MVLEFTRKCEGSGTANEFEKATDLKARLTDLGLGQLRLRSISTDRRERPAGERSSATDPRPQRPGDGLRAAFRPRHEAWGGRAARAFLRQRAPVFAEARSARAAPTHVYVT